MFLINDDFWEIRKTKQKGKGVFARKTISKGAIIGDYVGRLIDYKDIDPDEENKNLFLMYYSDTNGIYPDLNKPGIHLLNHSCSPNCFIYKYKDHTLAAAIKNIKKGEELTISYLLPPNECGKNCPHKCRCNSKNCKKTMHLTEDEYKKWQDFQEKKVKIKLNSEHKKNLKSFPNYPEVVPNNYIEKVNKLGIINKH